MEHALHPRTGFRRALVVDDDAWLQLLVRVMLESTKYQVDTANDGMDACRKMEAADYDAIICDVMMPKMDGPALHEHLQRMHRPEADRMLFITGARMDGEAVHLLHERGCRVLRKPFTADELNAAVDEVAGAA